MSNDISRTESATKNFVWAIVANIVNSFLGFVSRTIFIYTLGTTYLGLNGLFSNILGMLSLAELGFGSAISFNLYKPLADNDTVKIKSLIHFYKSAYRVIAAVVSVIGLAIMPFLDVIVKDGSNIDNLYLIYGIYLFNTVSSYLITYKSVLVHADQKSYLLTNIGTISRITSTVLQISYLIIFKNYIGYLLIIAIVQLCSNLFQNCYINKIYPYLKEKDIEYLSKAEKEKIFTKIKALMMHKIGEVAIYQTDSIITSAFISINAVGLVSNFTMLIDLVKGYIVSFFNSSSAGLGNIVATENCGRRKEIYERYDFLAFCFFGWSAICLYFLLCPFITIWLGSDKLVDEVTVALLCINYYLTGMRIPMANIKAAAGVYEQDWWSPLVQAVLNIVVSIVGAVFLGLKGIYIGTLVSSMVPNLVRPYIVYKYVFEIKVSRYYIEYIKHLGVLLASAFLIRLLDSFVVIDNVFVHLVVLGLACVGLPIIVIFIVYQNSSEMAYVISILKKIIKKR